MPGKNGHLFLSRFAQWIQLCKTILFEIFTVYPYLKRTHILCIVIVYISGKVFQLFIDRSMPGKNGHLFLSRFAQWIQLCKTILFEIFTVYPYLKRTHILCIVIVYISGKVFQLFIDRSMPGKNGHLFLSRFAQWIQLCKTILFEISF